MNAYLVKILLSRIFLEILALTQYYLIAIVTSIKIMEIKSKPLIIHIEPSSIAENLPKVLINPFIINVCLVNINCSFTKDNEALERNM